MSEEQPAAEAPEVPPEHPVLAAVREGVAGLQELSITEFRGITTLDLKDADRIADVCRFLRDDTELSFQLLLDICGIDYWGEELRYGLVYNLHSLKTNERIFIKIRVSAEDPYVPTLTGVWSGANWMEREVFDMFGVRFQNHPDLRRILTPDDLEGHPLRKDFPLGNVDVWPEGADTITAR